MDERFEELLGTAILGIDTLWGGDVMCPSGMGRFIADSWFSDEPLPRAYTHSGAAHLRQCGGVTGKELDRNLLEQYLRDLNLPEAIAGIRRETAAVQPLRWQYLTGLADCLQVVWDLA